MRLGKPGSRAGWVGMAVAVVVATAGLSAGTRAGDSPAPQAAPPAAEAVLAAAFANRYDVDLTADIELLMRDRSGQERRRVFRAAAKVKDGCVRSVGRLMWPHHLRGMTILTIENSDRSHDAFIYLPSLDKVRRITTTQRGDSFLGSDVTYEDLERQRVEDFELGALETREVGGEPAYAIRGRPLRRFSYAEVIFLIAQCDAVILEAQYLKRGDEVPFRVISAQRDSMLKQAGHILPTQLTVHNRHRGTTTEVRFENLRINPPIDDRVFSVMTLELERKLPRRVE